MICHEKHPLHVAIDQGRRWAEGGIVDGSCLLAYDFAMLPSQLEGKVAI